MGGECATAPSLHPKVIRRDLLRLQWPVSQKSRNFSGLFRVPQFPLYLRNAEVLSHQTSQSSLFFLHQKHVKGLDCRLQSAIRFQFDDWLFGPEKLSGHSRNRPLDRTISSRYKYRSQLRRALRMNMKEGANFQDSRNVRKNKKNMSKRKKIAELIKAFFI